MKQILFILLIAFCTASCNDWLDVRPETEQKDYDQFSTVDGFFDMLVGTYMEMAATNAYGERLTISNIESLANQWYMPESNVGYGRLADWELSAHDFTGDNARTAIAACYSQLFHIIANANLIIKYADEQADIFIDESMRKVVQGEAYAIRAYCQLDVLRLFGQLPQGGTRQVQLPYSFTTSIYDMPAYYDYAAYVDLLKKDLDKAEELLGEGDPILKYSFGTLNGTNNIVADNHLLYRQYRLNYWAVRALRARMHLYLGELSEAYNVASEIINAKDPAGNPVREMTGATDIANGYRLCPNECLFALSKYNIMDNTINFLGGGASGATYIWTSTLGLTMARLNALYAGEATTSHNRYQNCWNKNVKDNVNQPNYALITKYYWAQGTGNTMLNCQIVPMLRMSEVYLIAMETSTDLSEVNSWYKQYMVQHAVGTSVDFASLDDARTWIRAEYNREFFAEGQAFYTYKRVASPTMMGAPDKVMTEADYILPLPETEFNPNNL